jgi:hypothetical protein
MGNTPRITKARITKAVLEALRIRYPGLPDTQLFERIADADSFAARGRSVPRLLLAAEGLREAAVAHSAAQLALADAVETLSTTLHLGLRRDIASTLKQPDPAPRVL